MTIMRSSDFLGNLSSMDKKVKRKYVDWLQVLFDLDRPELKDYCRSLFYGSQVSSKKGKALSLRRCAYYTLKHYYSTTTIDELCMKVGL